MTFAIIHPDTLTTVGLRHLLHTYFEVSTECFSTVEDFTASHPGQYDAYFVTIEAFVACMEVLLPCKSRVVMLVNERVVDVWNGLTLCTNRRFEDLVDTLDKVVGSISRSSKTSELQEELTAREIDVLRGIARGLLNKEIADELHISINTVLSHRKNIVEKLGVKTVSGLTLYAVMNGIIDN